jgi:hypothetical protein
MKNLNLFKIIGLVMLAGIMAVNFTIGQNDYKKRGFSILSLNNIENQAFGGEGEQKLQHCPNYVRTTVIWWRNSSGVVLSERPSISWGWTEHSAKCCCTGTDMDACAFTLEDNACSSRATRPEKPDKCK